MRTPSWLVPGGGTADSQARHWRGQGARAESGFRPTSLYYAFGTSLCLRPVPRPRALGPQGPECASAATTSRKHVRFPDENPVAFRVNERDVGRCDGASLVFHGFQGCLLSTLYSP